MDLEAYFAEQDDWMSLPDETTDEYLRRVTAYRHRSQGPNAFALQLESSSASSSAHVNNDSGMGDTTNETMSNGLHDLVGDFGRNMKRKNSDLQLETAGKRKKVASHDNGSEARDHPANAPSSSSTRLPHVQPETSPTPQDQINLEHDFFPKPELRKRKTPPQYTSRSPRKKHQPEESQGLQPPPVVNENSTHELAFAALPALADVQDDIDSFTAVLNTAPKPSKVSQIPALRRNKRARSPQASPSPPPADHSPIASFSRTIRLSPKRQRKDELAAIPKQPPLDLRPLGEVIGKKKPGRHLSGPPTSPIEETSAFFPDTAFDKRATKKSVTAESSKMYQEVKKRIAKHSTIKQHDKVLKLDSKSIKTNNDVRKVNPAHTNESSTMYVSSSPSSRASSPGPAGPEMSKKAQKPTKPAVEIRKVKGKKEKPQPMTPAEYARKLQANMAAAAIVENASDGPGIRPTQKRKNSTVKFLDGKNIFYTGGDRNNVSETTRGRMDIIARFGGNLMPRFDPKVTSHIITDAHMPPTLRALGLKNLKEIPGHIPTVKWSWVLSVLGRESVLSKDETEAKLGEPWLHAAFAERMDAGYQPKKTLSLATFKGKGKSKILDDFRQATTSSMFMNAPSTVITGSHFAVEATDTTTRLPDVPLSPPASPELPAGGAKASSSKVTLDHMDSKSGFKDPLAEFYQEAKVQQLKDDGWSSMGELDTHDSDDEDPGPIQPVKRIKRGWTCDTKESQRGGDCPNQDIIDKLTELMQLHKSKLGDDDHWRAFSYSKCLRALRNYPQRIKTFEEARGIRGVGEKTARKIEEILQTGELRRIKYEQTKDVEVTRLFQGIYGVGQTIAFQWYSAGCRTLEDLREGKGGVALTSCQEIGLRFYDDINDRMLRDEAKAIFDLVKPIALAIDSKLFIEIMGSYRRGKATCGDIDILITRPIDDGSTHIGVLPRLLRELHVAGIITEDLAIPDSPHDLEAVYRGLCRLPHTAGARRRRIDILSVPWTSRGAALLYYTGDDIFNRAMRLKANVLGFSLNQRGLFGNVVRDPRDRRVKLTEGVLVASETEEEIFKLLGVPWQEPHERVRG